MNDDGERYDSRFDGGGPFRVTPEAGGISLESALRDFGPAAFDDLIPRVRSLANALAAAHAGGAVHGALHPSNVIIDDEATYVIAGERSATPYVAPELAAGGPPTPASDQFALAAIAYEWMLGRPIDGPASRPVHVRTIPGVDRATVSKAFTRALAPEPAARFASCAAFCDALAAAAAPELPLLAASADDDELDRIGALDPVQPGRDFDDVTIEDEPRLAPAAPDFDALDRVVPEADAVASWNPVAAVPVSEGQRFGGFALILAAIVGAIFGFAAGYMARPRALQSNVPQMAAPAPGTENEVTTAPKATDPPVETKRADAPTTSDPSLSPPAPEPQVEASVPARSLDVRLPQAAARASRPSPPARSAKPAAATGSLAVETRPMGASITINGKPGGKTPLTLSGLAPGEYRIVLSMPGYRNLATTVRVVAGSRARAAASLTAQEQE